jgi:hypothetical protein
MEFNLNNLRYRKLYLKARLIVKIKINLYN